MHNVKRIALEKNEQLIIKLPNNEIIDVNGVRSYHINGSINIDNDLYIDHRKAEYNHNNDDGQSLGCLTIQGGNKTKYKDGLYVYCGERGTFDEIYANWLKSGRLGGDSFEMVVYFSQNKDYKQAIYNLAECHNSWVVVEVINNERR